MMDASPGKRKKIAQSWAIFQAYLFHRFLLNNLYSSNHNTEVTAMTNACPNSARLNPVTLKNPESDGKYNSAKSNIKVKAVTAANKILRFLKLSNRL